MQVVFVTGTAGAGKSQLTSILAPWYEERGSTVATVNLDPGATNLPYDPIVDIRDFIDLESIMTSHQLGPNGALILSADMIATRLPELQEAIDEYNPDYTIIDTPGQMELFAYRPSGPYIVENITAEGKAVLFLFDSILASTATHFVSLALLAASLQLRLQIPSIPVLSKIDLIGTKWKKIMKWASNATVLEEDIRQEASASDYLLATGVLRSLVKTDSSFELMPFSAQTSEGLVELSATITRILKSGEEVDD